MIKTVITDGNGKGLDVTVHESTVSGRTVNALDTGIARINKGVILQVANVVSGTRFDEALSIDGLGVTIGQNVNGSVTPVTFKILPDETRDIIISGVDIIAVDNNVKLELFLAAPILTTGFQFDFQSDGVHEELASIHDNTDLGAFSSIGGFDMLFGGSGQDSVLAKYKPIPNIIIRKSRTFGAVSKDDYFSSIVQDDLTGLTKLLVNVHGYYSAPQEF